jgi:hypothetical protein
MKLNSFETPLKLNSKISKLKVQSPQSLSIVIYSNIEIGSKLNDINLKRARWKIYFLIKLIF